MRNWPFAICAAMSLACASGSTTPEADTGAQTADAGASGSHCDGTVDPVSGACFGEGIGDRLLCPSSRFFADHPWVAEAREAGTKVLFVAAGGSGDGSSASSPTGDPSAVLAGGDAALLLLAKGEHQWALPGLANLSIVGPCASLTTLRVNGGLQAAAGASLRLWGLTLDNDDAEQPLLRATDAATLRFEHLRLRSEGDGIVIDGATEVLLSGSSVEQVKGSALTARGTVSGIIIDDNHFVGPLTGDGVFVGPLTGDGVFRVASNRFGKMGGSGLRMIGLALTDARSGIIIDDNHFVGPLTGDGVFVGPLTGDGVFRIAGNRLETVGGDGLSVMEPGINGEISGNIIDGSASVGGDALVVIGAAEGVELAIRDNGFAGMMGGGMLLAEGKAKFEVAGNRIGEEGSQLSGVGIAVFDMTGQGQVDVTSNTVIAAQGLGLSAQRNSAAVSFSDNVVEGTHSGDRGPSSRLMGYGAGLFDNGALVLNNNRFSNNAHAALVFDQSAWGSYFRRPDLAGDALVETHGNDYGGQLACQQRAGDSAASGDPLTELADSDAMPVERSNRAFRCGNGEIDGAEECDPGADGDSRCDPSCRLLRGQPIAIGAAFFCGLSDMGRLFCGGDNSAGQVLPGARVSFVGGHTERSDVDQPLLAVAAGHDFACGQTMAGHVLCWGQSEAGQMGRGDAQGSHNMVAPVLDENQTALSGVVDLDLGGANACATTADGAVRCWGDATSGLIGDGGLTRGLLADSPVRRGRADAEPDALSPVDDAAQVAVGGSSACLRSHEGDLWCWGLNDAGQLAIDAQNPLSQVCTTFNGISPCSRHAVQSNLSDVQDLALGGAHGCAITSDRRVSCWGKNNHGQVNGRASSGAEGPQTVATVGGAVSLALGLRHSCALIDGGEVRCWGANDWSQLGRTEGAQGIGPVMIGDTEQVLGGQIGLTASQDGSCALSGDGSVNCWGNFGGNGSPGEVVGSTEITRLPR